MKPLCYNFVFFLFVDRRHYSLGLGVRGVVFAAVVFVLRLGITQETRLDSNSEICFPLPPECSVHHHAQPLGIFCSV